MKYFILSIDSIVDSFSLIDASEPFEFSFKAQGQEDILSKIQADDCILVYKGQTDSQINVYLKVLENNGGVLKLKKILEVADGATKDKLVIPNFDDNTMLTEIEENKFMEILNSLISKFQYDTLRERIPYNYSSISTNAKNEVIYGTPGCGKSYYVQHVLLPSLGVQEGDYSRTTFYQDYTNTDFIGQILPKIKSDKSVTYEFNPGPFAKALKMAIEKPNISVALVIEELNRGNAPSIFGDIFQLLDRDENGRSRYSIVNTNLQDYLEKCFPCYSFNYIQIPANLSIFATMNTSDQNVFTLDTAFKRRWIFTKLRNEFKEDHIYRNYFVPGMNGITWEHLVTSINKAIIDKSDELMSEDKQIGVYFIDKEMLCQSEDETTDEIKIKLFAYKFFEYLWDDVAKYNRPKWFGNEIKTLDAVLDKFVEAGEKVFVDGIISA